MDKFEQKRRDHKAGSAQPSPKASAAVTKMLSGNLEIPINKTPPQMGRKLSELWRDTSNLADPLALPKNADSPGKRLAEQRLRDQQLAAGRRATEGPVPLRGRPQNDYGAHGSGAQSALVSSSSMRHNTSASSSIAPIEELPGDSAISGAGAGAGAGAGEDGGALNAAPLTSSRLEAHTAQTALDRGRTTGWQKPNGSVGPVLEGLKRIGRRLSGGGIPASSIATSNYDAPGGGGERRGGTQRRGSRRGGNRRKSVGEIALEAAENSFVWVGSRVGVQMGGMGAEREYLKYHTEYKRLRKAVPCGLNIFIPISKTRQMWNATMVVLILWNIIILPIDLAFQVQAGSVWEPLEMVFDFFFIFDCFMNFFTPFGRKPTKLDNSAWEIRRPLIVRNYAAGWFLIDFISSIPLNLIFMFNQASTSTTDGDNPNLDLLRTAKVGRLLKNVRILRIGRLIKLFGKSVLGAEIINTWRIVRLLLLFALMAHTLGCLYYFISYVCVGRGVGGGRETCHEKSVEVRSQHGTHPIPARVINGAVDGLPHAPPTRNQPCMQTSLQQFTRV